jgi:glycosyltransferase involved in cell wall biosynthesis
MKIRLIGQRNTQGIGNHYASFADALKKIRHIGDRVEEINHEDHQHLARAVAESTAEDINISFVAMNIHEHFRGHNIQWIVFESTRVPEHIMAVLRPAEQVWVPSDWGYQVLVDNGIPAEQIRVIPEGIDGNLFHAYGRRGWDSSRPFRFLSVGKYEQRKSFDETIQAFAQIFGNTPMVELIIKSNYFVNTEQKFQELQAQIQNLGLENVKVLWGTVDNTDIADLYKSCDAFVFPTKGEGWGFPLIEAAASGMPIITTMYSGHTHFLKHIDTGVIGVDYVMSPITCPEYQLYYPDSANNWGEWARPDVYSIAEAMKYMWGNYSNFAANAHANSYFIRSAYTWANSANLALIAMEEIAQI